MFDLNFYELAWIAVLIIMCGVIMLIAFVLIWFIVIFELEDLNTFWMCECSQFHFVPYLHVTQEIAGNHHSFGIEIGWLSKWCAIEWNFLDVNNRDRKEAQNG